MKKYLLLLGVLLFSTNVRALNDMANNSVSKNLSNANTKI